MLLFALLILVSAIITFLRYGNFYPFLSDTVYEFATNTKGVSTGGAIMSVVFSALNYLTGFAFFVIMVNLIKSSRFMKRVVGVFCFSITIAFSFGLYQLLFNKEIGNNLSSIQHGLINGTFKDALSFSVFIVLVVPFLLALSIGPNGLTSLLSVLALILSLVMVFFTGSKIGLVCVFISIILFVWLASRYKRKTVKYRIYKKFHRKIGVAVLIAVIVVSAAVFLTTESDSDSTSTVSRIKYMVGQGVIDLMYRWRGPLWRGALSMLKDFPVSGMGVGAYIIEVANYEKEFFKYETPQSAENYFLQIGSEMGILGLALIFLIFWQIAKALIRRTQVKGKNIRYNILYIGVGISIFVYFINLWFHTYIGSYEVKYTFWLLVAIIFSREEGQIRQHFTLGSRKFVRLAGLILILVFSGTLLWNATHSLSLVSLTKKYQFENHFGFYEMEKTPEGIAYEWTKQNAGMTVDIKKPVMGIRIRASHPDIAQKPVHVSIYLLRDSFRERRLIDEIVLKNSDWVGRAYFLPNDVDQRRVLLFKVDRTWNPKKVLGVPDPRELGIAFGKIKFKGKDYLDSGKPVKFIQ
jgi:O-antigen ligase